jgi:hypothetical protein
MADSGRRSLSVRDAVSHGSLVHGPFDAPLAVYFALQSFRPARELVASRQIARLDFARRHDFLYVISVESTLRCRAAIPNASRMTIDVRPRCVPEIRAAVSVASLHALTVCTHRILVRGRRHEFKTALKVV